MAIERRIPVEIEDYREKIFLGMDKRQLLCVLGAVACGAATFIICKKLFHMTWMSISYLVMAEAVPFCFIGFLHRNGQPFEKYFVQMMRRRFGKTKFVLTTDGTEGETNGIKKSIPEAEKRNTRKKQSERRRRTMARIKAARREEQAAKKARSGR